jgi:hypothetical protein
MQAEVKHPRPPNAMNYAAVFTVRVHGQRLFSDAPLDLCAGCQRKIALAVLSGGKGESA